jgi:DNA anti-recombination protein RmuC
MSFSEAQHFAEWLVNQPLVQVMILALIGLGIGLVIIIALLLRVVFRALFILRDSIKAAEKLADRIESLADKTALSSEQVAAMSLVLVSVRETFANFKANMARWTRADQAQKVQIAQQLKTLREQTAALVQSLRRIEAHIERQSPPIRDPVKTRRGAEP